MGKQTNMTLELGFSPCPNDTFIFDGMINGYTDIGDFSFQPRMEDVETLNRWALEARLPLSKLSFSTYLQVSDRYVLFDCGSALGEGVGPLLLSSVPPPDDPEELIRQVCKSRIAIPGKNTTANLLLSMAFPEAGEKKEVVFHEIEEQVLSARVDLGLVIHESRFTYAAKGLYKWMDLGDWWENKTGVPIPLGGICIKRTIDPELALQIQGVMQESLARSWRRYPELSTFVKVHAQEMEEDVMRQHIELYVNDYTRSLGEKGRLAVSKMFELAGRAGWPIAREAPVFVQ